MEGSDNDTSIGKQVGIQPSGICTSTWQQQVSVLYRRFQRGYVRYAIFAPLNVVQWFVMTMLISLCWWRLGETEDNLPDRSGFAFFTLSYWSLNATYEAQSVLPLERAGLNKDRAAGMYRTSAYVVAKFLAETPGKLILPTMYMVISFYATAVYDAAPDALAGWIFTLWLCCLAGEAMGLCIGSLFTSIQKSLVMTTVVSLGLMIVGGFYVKNLPYYFVWSKWLSFMKYGFDALLRLEYQKDRMFVCQWGQWDVQNCYPQLYPTYVSKYGERILSGEEICNVIGLQLSLSQYWAVLIGFTVTFRTLAYLALRFLHTDSTVRLG